MNHASDRSLKVLQVSAFEDLRLTEQVMALATGLAEAGDEVTTAGPATARLRTRFSRQGLTLALLNWSPEKDPEDALAKLTRLLQTGEFSLIHAHEAAALRLVLAVQGRRKPAERLPVVAHLHRLPADLPALARWREARRLRGLLRQCAAVVVPSPVHREALAALLGTAAPAAEIVHPIIATRKPVSGAEAGFLRHRFGVSGHAALVGISTEFAAGEAELFLPAARQVLEALANLEFVVIGDGPGLAACQELVHDLGLGGATVFISPPRSLTEIISIVNVLVALGESGGVYVDALQALQFELPVVTPPLAPLAEILPLFPQAHLLAEATPAGLAAAIGAALHSIPDAGATRAASGSSQVPTLVEFMGGTQVWELDKDWEGGSATANTAPQILALQQYSSEAVVRGLRTLYQRALATP